MKRTSSRAAILVGAAVISLTLAGACAPNTSHAIKPAMDAPTHFLVREVVQRGRAIAAEPVPRS